MAKVAPAQRRNDQDSWRRISGLAQKEGRQVFAKAFPSADLHQLCAAVERML
jgi:hypothetical protein